MEDEKIIIEVEKLLSHTITEKSFILDGKGGLIEVDKDNISLYNELADVNKRLDDLYYEGEITLEQKKEMQAAVKRKYEILIEKAPKKENTSKKVVEETTVEQKKEDDFVPLYLFDDEPSSQTREEDDFVPLHLFDDDSFSNDRNKRKRR